MNPLNDDELNCLLRQAKEKPPKHSPELSGRVLEAYQRSRARPMTWWWLLLRPMSIPLPVGVLAAILLVLAGTVGGRALRPPSAIVQTHIVEVPVTHERVVYRDCLSEQQESSAQIASLTLRELQPVREIKPRIVRSIRDDQ
jgi:hypothetical protein